MTESCAAATLNPPGAPRFGTVGRALPGSEVMVASRRRSAAARPARVRRLPPRRGGDAPRRSSTAGCTPGTPGSLSRDGLPDADRPQEGPDHHLERQEHDARSTSRTRCARRAGSPRPWSTATAGPTSSAWSRSTPTRRRSSPSELGIDRRPRERWRGTSACTQLLQADVDAANARFARIEQIKRFGVLDHDLTQAAGELTPTHEGQARARLRALRAICSTALYAEQGEGGR